MNKKLSSAIKLLVSLGFGVFLIWYYYNQISKPENYIVSEKISAYTEYFISDILFEDSTYVKVYDTIAVLNAGNEQFYMTSEKEGFFKYLFTEGQSIKPGDAIFSVTIDLWRIMKDVFQRTNYFWLGFSIFLSLLSHISRAIRWKMLLTPLGYDPKTSNTFFAVMIMYIANLAFPRAGEVLRCYTLARYENVPVQKSLGTMVTERAIDLLMLIITMGLIFIFSGDMLMQIISSLSESFTGSGGGNSSNWFTYALIGLVIAVVGYFIYKWGFGKVIDKFKQLALEMAEGIKSVRNVNSPAWFIFHSVFVWLMYLLVVLACFQTLPETKGLGFEPGMMVLVFGSIGIILVQGGLGIYPLIVSGVLFLFGLPKALGYAFGWVIWSAQTVLVIAGGFISLVLINVLNEKYEVEEPEEETGDEESEEVKA